MKSAWIVIAVAAVVVAGIWLTRTPPVPIAAPATSAVPTMGVLGVNELMRNVDKYAGQVRVQGVVDAVGPQSLALIDASEASECGVGGGCAELVLPVRWTGTMPRVGQRVQLSGSAQDSGGKLVFVASDLMSSPAGAIR